MSFSEEFVLAPLSGEKKALSLGTAFFHTTEGEKFRNKSLLDLSDSLLTYYRCLVVFFASIRRFDKESKLYLFTNKTLPSPFDTFLSNDLSVRIEIISEGQLQYVTSKSIRNNFPGCLFALDVIEYVSRTGMISQGEWLFLLDNDMLFLQSPEGLLKGGKRGDGERPDYLTYRLDYDLSIPVSKHHQITLPEAFARFFGHELPPPAQPFSYYGGELYGLTKFGAEILAGEIGGFWRFLEDKVDLFGGYVTEEHVLTVLLHQHANAIADLNACVRRVWTADTFNNLDGTEMDRVLLHLPAEKSKLFKDAFEKMTGNGGRLDLEAVDLRSLVEGCLRERGRLTLKRVVKRLGLKFLKR